MDLEQFAGMNHHRVIIGKLMLHSALFIPAICTLRATSTRATKLSAAYSPVACCPSHHPKSGQLPGRRLAGLVDQGL
jgi:hypothetical protein